MKEQGKKWYMSKTVWGGLVAVAAAVAGGFGYAVGPDEQEAITGAVVSVAGGLGGLYAIYGRIKATDKIEK